MKYTERILIFSLACLFGASSLAAVPAAKKTAKAVVKPASKILQGEGASFGGLAGSGFTLLDVRRTVDAKKKIERLVIDVGDMQGLPLKGFPGYYHAELKKAPQQLVIDFAQMPNSHLTLPSLKARLKESKAIRNANLSLDPVDTSLSLTLDLQKDTKVRVYQVAGNKSTSKVVVDLISE